MAPEGTAPPPLVGREIERAAISHLMDAAAAGHAGPLFIAGPEGSGKSCLLDVARREAEARGWTLLWSCGSAGDHAPYRLWHHAFAGARSPKAPAAPAPRDEVRRRGIDSRPLYALVPSGDDGEDEGPRLSSTGPSSPSSWPEGAVHPATTDRLSVADATVTFLDRFEALTGGRPAAILFDDLQHADSASIAVLRLMARNLRGRPVAIVAALTPDEGPPEEGTPSLLAVLRDLGREAGATLAMLSPLRDSDLRVLAQRWLGAPLGREHEPWSPPFDGTDGRPYILEALVQFAVREGLVDRQGERFVPRGSDRRTPTLRALVHRSLALVEVPALDVLRAAAILGSPFDGRGLEALTGKDEPRLEELRQGLEASGFLVRAPDGSHGAFAHPIIGEVVLDEMSSDTGRALHARAATWVAEHLPFSAEAVAHHWYAAGDRENAPEWLQEAWEAADTRGDGDAMVRLARCGHEMALRADRAPEDEALWLHREALGYARTGDLRRAIRTADHAARLAPPGLARARILCTIASVQADRGQPGKAEEALDRAAEEPVPPSEVDLTGGLVGSTRLHCWGRVQAYERIRREGPELLARFAATGAPRDVIRAQRNLAFAQMSLAEFEEARRTLREATELARKYDLPLSRRALLSDLGGLAFFTGDLVTAEKLLVESVEVARRSGSVGALIASVGNLGETLLVQGDFDAAELNFREALVLARKGGMHHIQIIFLPMLALAQIESGDPGGARTSLDAVLVDPALGSRQDTERFVHALNALLLLGEGHIADAVAESDRAGTSLGGQFGPFCARVTARVRSSQGNHAEAERLLQEVARLGRESGRALEVAATTEALGRLYAALRRTDEARSAFEEAERRYAACGAAPRASRLAARRRGLEAPGDAAVAPHK